MSGELSLFIEGINITDSMGGEQGDGIILAHDLMEHLNGPEEVGQSVWDELQALGACWWIRGQWGQLRPNSYSSYSIEENLASDVVNLARYVSIDTIKDKVRKSYPCEDDHFIDGIFQFATLEALLYEDVEFSKKDFKLYQRYVKQHIRTGYRKAVKKYPDSLYARDVFFEVAEKVSDVVSNLNFEGQQFKLWQNQRGDVRISEIEQDFY